MGVSSEKDILNSKLFLELREAEKKKKEKIKKLKGWDDAVLLEKSMPVFNYSLNQKEISPEGSLIKMSKKRNYFLFFLFLIIILIGFFSFDNYFNNQQDSINTNFISEQPKIEPITVVGAGTNVIIKNNLERDVSLNVTYRIYSNWFGIDSTESKIFNVNMKEEKSFKVYDNDGCNTAPCSVGIINFEELK